MNLGHFIPVVWTHDGIFRDRPTAIALSDRDSKANRRVMLQQEKPDASSY